MAGRSATVAPLRLALLSGAPSATDCQLSAGSAQLLALVASKRHRRISRQAAVDGLWTGTDWAIGRRRLNSALHRLRTELAEADAADRVQSTADEIALQLNDGDVVDLVEFDHAFERALAQQPLSEDDERCLTGAVELYESFSLPSGSSDWQILLATRLENQAITIRSRLAAELLDTDRAAAALQHVQVALEMDSLREDLHRMAMRCHLAIGDRAGALRRFEQLKVLLAHELDASPMPETIRLIVPDPPPTRTPATVDPALVSRSLHDIRSQLVDLLTAVDGALNSINSIPGANLAHRDRVLITGESPVIADWSDGYPNAIDRNCLAPHPCKSTEIISRAPLD